MKPLLLLLLLAPAARAADPDSGAGLGQFRQLLADARAALSAERPGDAEKDLLAAAGLICEASAQKPGTLAAQAAARQAFAEAYPLFQASLRGGAAAPAYMAALASRLDALASAQDFMRQALAEEAAALRGAFRGGAAGAAVGAGGEGAPFLRRVLAKRVMDKEFLSIAEGMVAAAADARAATLSEALAANDAALAAELPERQRRYFAALRAKYPQPGRLRKLKACLFPDRDVKEALALEAAEKFISGQPPVNAGLVPEYHAFYNSLNVLRAGLAVKRFRRAHRRLPASLGQLVPGYLPAVPADTFASSGTLVYVKGKKTFSVYSVGPDRADGGGRPALDLKAFLEGLAVGAGDIVFKGD